MFRIRNAQSLIGRTSKFWQHKLPTTTCVFAATSTMIIHQQQRFQNFQAQQFFADAHEKEIEDIMLQKGKHNADLFIVLGKSILELLEIEDVRLHEIEHLLLWLLDIFEAHPLAKAQTFVDIVKIKKQQEAHVKEEYKLNLPITFPECLAHLGFVQLKLKKNDLALQNFYACLDSLDVTPDFLLNERLFVTKMQVLYKMINMIGYKITNTTEKQLESLLHQHVLKELTLISTRLDFERLSLDETSDLFYILCQLAYHYEKLYKHRQAVSVLTPLIAISNSVCTHLEKRRGMEKNEAGFLVALDHWYQLHDTAQSYFMLCSAQDAFNRGDMEEAKHFSELCIQHNMDLQYDPHACTLFASIHLLCKIYFVHDNLEHLADKLELILELIRHENMRLQRSEKDYPVRIFFDIALAIVHRKLGNKVKALSSMQSIRDLCINYFMARNHPDTTFMQSVFHTIVGIFNASNLKDYMEAWKILSQAIDIATETKKEHTLDTVDAVAFSPSELLTLFCEHVLMPLEHFEAATSALQEAIQWDHSTISQDSILLDVHTAFAFGKLTSAQGKRDESIDWFRVAVESLHQTFPQHPLMHALNAHLLQLLDEEKQEMQQQQMVARIPDDIDEIERLIKMVSRTPTLEGMLQPSEIVLDSSSLQERQRALEMQPSVKQYLQHEIFV